MDIRKLEVIAAKIFSKNFWTGSFVLRAQLLLVYCLHLACTLEQSILNICVNVFEIRAVQHPALALGESEQNSDGLCCNDWAQVLYHN